MVLTTTSRGITYRMSDEQVEESTMPKNTLGNGASNAGPYGDSDELTRVNDENIELRQRLAAVQTGAADDADKTRREDKERDEQEQRYKDDVERLQRENEELKSQLDDATAPKGRTSAKAKSTPATDSSSTGPNGIG